MPLQQEEQEEQLLLQLINWQRVFPKKARSGKMPSRQTNPVKSCRMNAPLAATE